MTLLYCSQAVLLVHFTHVAQSITKSFEMVNAKIEMEVTSPASVDGSHACFIRTNEGAWILLHICYVILLLNSSTVVTNQADETGQTICKLINKDLDPNLRKQLEGFLLQLPHHNARFSTRGYFPLNNETLTAMAGAVTTYLVILIQFQTEPSST
ncbi:gustatory and pheromone receptor 32a-like [Homalodisca vitripennis]|uniref:gustatory and pheromone receptor 32a-like n=1 Tax=Homalodisca vitripennis TaxID=197043 RepID=UPI001EEBEB36|nr:gustatory and pheromone receptor 32a-like [Homalodisca vitripennis]